MKTMIRRIVARGPVDGFQLKPDPLLRIAAFAVQCFRLEGVVEHTGRGLAGTEKIVFDVHPEIPGGSDRLHGAPRGAHEEVARESEQSQQVLANEVGRGIVLELLLLRRQACHTCVQHFVS